MTKDLKSYPLGSPGWDLGAPAPGVHGYFCSFLSKFEGLALDFICIHARFYLDPMCEINSKGPDPPMSPQGYSLPKRDPRGVQPLDFISFQFQVKPVDFIFGKLGLWILFEGPDLWSFWNVQNAPKYWFPCPIWVLAKIFGLRMLDLGP